MGLSKMIKAYFLGALSLIGSILMWGAVVILAIILLVFHMSKKKIPLFLGFRVLILGC